MSSRIKSLTILFIFNLEIYNYKDTEYGRIFFDDLLNAKYNFIKNSLPNKDIAHKSGYSIRGYNDHGIVFDTITPYIISIMLPYPDETDNHKEVLSKIVKLSDKVMAFESNIYDNVTKKYDYIVTNLPIRAGKNVVYKILFEAKEHLKNNGTLYYVVNKNQGALTTKKDLEEIADVKVIEKNKGFYVFKVKLNWQIALIVLLI